MRGAIPSRSWGARSEVITSRRPAVMISFIVWKNSSCVKSLPAMNWTSSISSRSAFRSRCLNPIVSFSFSARMNSTMNFSADIDTTRAPRLRARKAWPIACSRWVLPRPGSAMDEQRIEADRRRSRERPRGGRRDFVRLADDEGFEPVARVEIRCVGIALCRRRGSSRISSGAGRGASAAAITRTSRTTGKTVFHASVSRSPKCERTQSAMNWLGMTMSSDPPSGSKAPSSAGFSQPSNVRAPRSRRSPVRIDSQAASSGAATGAAAGSS